MRSARSIISSRRESPMTRGSVLPLCNARPARQERTGAGACAAIGIFSPRLPVLGAYESTTCSACQPRMQPIHGTFLAHPIRARHNLGTVRNRHHADPSLPPQRQYGRRIAGVERDLGQLTGRHPQTAHEVDHEADGIRDDRSGFVSGRAALSVSSTRSTTTALARIELNAPLIRMKD